jgi:hypothetical protein
MQHTDAVRIMASEKYLLHELTPAEREEFEEHFFDCSECAFDVRTGSALIEHSKIVLSEPAATQKSTKVPRPAGWLVWLRPSIAVPALAILLLLVGYLNVFPLSKSRRATGSLNLPEILPSATLVSVRGDRIPVVRIHPNQSFLLFVDIPVENRFASYVCELRSPAGALVWSIPVSAETAKDTLYLHVPPAQFAPGMYNLTVQGVVPDPGQNKIALARYPFELAQQ